MNWSIHHVNLQTFDVRKSKTFYEDVIGLQSRNQQHNIGTGSANLGTSEDNLAVIGDGSRGIHLLTPIPDFARNTGLTINPAVGGHVAFNVPDIAAVIKRLDQARIYYQDAGRFSDDKLWQIYLYDPSGNLIEVNQTF